MEVHAHTHIVRKKWSHYFWEFLSLAQYDALIEIRKGKEDILFKYYNRLYSFRARVDGRVRFLTGLEDQQLFFHD